MVGRESSIKHTFRGAHIMDLKKIFIACTQIVGSLECLSSAHPTSRKLFNSVTLFFVNKPIFENVSVSKRFCTYAKLLRNTEVN